MTGKDIEKALTNKTMSVEQAIIETDNAIQEIEKELLEAEGGILYQPIDLMDFYRYMDSDLKQKTSIDKFTYDKYTWIKKTLRKLRISLESVFSLYWLKNRLSPNQLKEPEDKSNIQGKGNQSSLNNNERGQEMTAKELREAMAGGEMTPERVLLNTQHYCELIDKAVENTLDIENSSEDENGEYPLDYAFYASGHYESWYVWEHSDNTELLRDYAILLKRTPYPFDEVMRLQELKHEIEKKIKIARGDVSTLEPVKQSIEGKNEEQKKPKNPTDSETTGKIVWKWGKSDLAWLYESLTLQHAIDCNEATFAAAFITKDMESMPSALSDYRKSPRPGRQDMKTIQDAISTHKPEEIRN